MKKRLHISMIYIGIFISICIAMTMNSSESEGFTSSKLEISIIDMDNSEASKALTEYIGKNHKLVEVENDKDAMLDALYYMSADIIFTINEGYSENLANGRTDELFSDYRVPGTFSAEFFDTQINQYISTINAYVASGMPVEEAAEKAAELSENTIEAKIINKDDDAAGTSFSMYFQYLAYILISVLLTGLCPTLLVMTGKEIRNRTNCSPTSVTKQMTQIVAGTVIFSAALYLLLMIVAAVLYKAELFTEKGLLAILNGFAFLLFAMMFALFVAVIAPNPKTVDMISNVFGLGMSFLCGVFVPQQLLSETVLNIGKFLPAFWYIKANNMLAGTNNEIYSTGSFMTCIGVELAFSAALFCVILLVAKAKRKSRSV